MNSNPLPYSFYKQDTIHLAKALIGTHLMHTVAGEIVVGRIIETEAYLGVLDKACHSYSNKQTKRTAILFGPPGRVYTYTMHTHCLLNIVAGKEDQPEAVLIRGVKPVFGFEKMEALRGMKATSTTFSNGPGKLTKALGITMNHYGHFLCEDPLIICEGSEPTRIEVTNRIGIGKADQAKHYPWRFIEKEI
ncbi:DNA-3-methyladenine glycosylase [Alkalihalobacillus xiaoxiensis]|uniref:Putative 3-methyladenine DNA glycosylase n=1 Tax=Shouchella xiaoxiensis TaxID=766895 RepID=A0ABS2SZV5_9BACI|nr:DNA-3-methyladenine glycosylase [Shouchella xiaoxiensis]MBM7841019.1 DNA-3-methyladenine glycosylase [Shouchella xiaoxiensis]